MPPEDLNLFSQRWLIESDSVEPSLPEPGLSAADIEKASQALLKSGHSGLVRCLLFATCGDIIPIWTRPTNEEDVDILDLSHLFPNGYSSYRIPAFPILNSPMIHNWRIFVTQSPESAPENVAISQKLGFIWRGNVVLAKYGNTTFMEKDWLKNVRNTSTEFAMVLLDA
ncbi:hypothetical protein CVT26_003946 [Gymnopilus dilepis]|uniref:Uncharacterized protein n=1 Tax=Gymnopilus dilepis TaxID=231916 RepID=A0A409WTV8_9AGAR|nr:hypothetical protein CVT26_003946 [Gymnopilus dilepis]